MTLDRFRPVADRLLTPFVGAARRLGLSPDAVSVVALAVALAAAGAYVLAAREPLAYLLGAVLVFCNGWLDLIDGALAREMGTSSDAGDLLDHVIDRYADVAIVAGLAAGVGDYRLGLAAVTGVLLTSYLGTQAQAVGLERVYSGLLGRADRLALIGVATGVTGLWNEPVGWYTLAGWALVVLAVVGHVTAAQRFFHAYRALGSE